MTQIVYLPGQDPGRVRYETQRARSLADSRCDAILRVIADEYRDGVTPRELSVRMWRSGRTNTPRNVKAAVASLRYRRLLVWDDCTQSLRLPPETNLSGD
ncbi:hypothetical protein [Streptomyces virginiae]|uniref:hypothetical protein n=1 Tax=Streptomyces virginiae TaxID=1961 RepID=UPI00225BB481|nr:hypothetical protein [Streptomyces virginiae]MCX4962977.1 hypothetical protein [Streptomyces virginiae]